MIRLCLLFTIALSALSNVAGAEARKPSVDEIFDFLLTDLETKDLLYVCDFFKTYQYVCNVTQLGVPSLKNHQSPPKKGAEKLQKVVLTNVSGHWSDSDGFMKSSYVKADYLDIVAKCFFRTTYYECFGVPRCEEDSSMSPCSGGQPWRGSFKGAPNTGFTANITAEAQMGSALGPDGNDTNPSSSTETPDATTADDYDKPEPVAANTTARSSSQGSSVISLEFGAENLPSEANTTIDGQPVYIKKFSNVDNETGMTSEGVVAIMPGTVISRSSGRFNKPDGKGHVGGSVSSFSRSSVSSGGKASASSSSGFSGGDFGAGFPFGQNLDFGSGETQQARGPRPSLFSTLFSPNIFGSLFDADDFDSQPPQKTRRTVRPPNSTAATANKSGNARDNGDSPFTSLRSFIMNFQDMVTSSILNSFQSSPFFSGRMQQRAQMQPMQQVQQMAPMARSSMDLTNIFPAFGFQLAARPVSDRRQSSLWEDEDEVRRK